jgi:competence protein ComEA
MKTLLVAFLLLLGADSVVAAVNLNTAGEQELTSLKGIGPAKARAILDYRAKHGSFHSIDELDKVPGFGAKTVARLQGELTLGASSDPTAPGLLKPLLPLHH